MNDERGHACLSARSFYSIDTPEGKSHAGNNWSYMPIGKEFLLYLAKKFNEMGTFFPSYMPIGKRFYRPVYSYFHVKITFQKRKSVSKLLYLRNVSIFFCY